MAIYNLNTVAKAQSHSDFRIMADVPRFHVQRSPDKTAMIFNDRHTSYADFDADASAFANGMIKAGLKPQTRIAYLETNSDYFFSLLFACGKANTVMCGVNWRLADPEVQFIIDNAKAEIVFVGENHIAILEAILPQLPCVKKIVTLSGSHNDWQSIEQWRAEQSTQDPNLDIDDEDVCIQMYTSGTTGNPKGVEISNRAIFSSSVDDREDIKWNLWSQEDISLVAMPCSHVGGSRWGVMGLTAGCLNIVISEFNPAVVLDVIQEYKVSKLFLVPAALQFVLALPQSRETNYDSIEYVLYGASPIPLALLKEAIEVFQCGFVQLYGMTETAGPASYLPPSDHDINGNERMKSAGKALPNVEMAIRDDNGNVLPAGEVGEICIHSPANMTSYWKLPEATQKTLIDGWIYTGDAGYMDADGYVYVHDRIKDMIVSGAENIYPAEVESALFGHEAIADCAVIGVPDEKWGEAVKACVVLKPGATASAEAIIAFAKERIAGFKAPKSVDFHDVLPRNTSGKLLKRELRAPFWEGRERQVN